MSRSVSKKIVKRVSEIRGHHRAVKTIRRLSVILSIITIGLVVASVLIDNKQLSGLSMVIAAALFLGNMYINFLTLRRKSTIIDEFGVKEYNRQKTYV